MIRFSKVLGLVFFTVVLGCGSSGPALYEVTGKVTYQGDPVPGATITFQPERGRTSVGVTDDAGNYFLRYTKDRNGAIPGKHKVFLSFDTRPSDEAAEKAFVLGELTQVHPKQAEIREQFGPSSKEPIRKEVTKNWQVINIEL